LKIRKEYPSSLMRNVEREDIEEKKDTIHHIAEI